MKKRLFSLLLCGAMLFSLCTPVAAEETGTYLTWDDAQKKLVEENIPDPIKEVTTDTKELNDTTTSGGWYIVRGSDITVNDRINVTGNVHLILTNECTLNAAKGVYVCAGNSLTIYAQTADEALMGILNAKGDTNAAGIGGSARDDSDKSNCGTVVINGGKVTANGGTNSAGIGGGAGGAGGTITITGGTVTATSEGNGAGIGSGGYGAGGKITITGGTVKATSKGEGAGIGGGVGSDDGGVEGDGGEITISGGEVTATSEDDGAGIGGGAGGAGGKITITSGTVTATSDGYGAGIGGGRGGEGGKITISDGKVTAASNYDGAGIGGGAGGAGGTITIEGGVVTAASIGDGAGIGGGVEGDGGEITISGGEVTATSEDGGAGIGGGFEGDGGKITITGGTVTATSDGDGAGIGGGDGGAGETITITGGTVEATSGYDGAGIGGGWNGSGGTIIISDGKVTATSEGSGAGIGGGELAGGGTITIDGGTVEAIGGNGAGIGGGDGGDGGNITITGGKVTATSNGDGAGIGGGYGAGTYGGGDGGEITISGGTVTATSEGNGAGIGGGASAGGGTITIDGGTVEAIGGNGEGIGGGYWSRDGGTFTADGNAFIVASGISDNDGDKKAQWSGVIFEEDSGQVYGSEITLTTAAEIPVDKILEIEADQTLIIGENVKLTNSGVIDNLGTIENRGTIDGYGMIMGNEIVVHEAAEGWEHDGSSHWHPCAVTDCAEQFDKAAHNFGEWTVDKSATASAAGSRHRTCGACGYTQTATIPPTHSHSYGQAWVSDAAGHWHECSCGNKSGYAAHTPGPAATCTEPQTCTVCGYTLAAAPGHIPGPAATCTEPQTCTVCGHTLAAALGHTPGPAATCAEPQTCTVCGQEVVPALGHSFGEKVPQKDATTTSTGMKAHYLCSRCGNYFDENKNPTTADALTIPKKTGGSGGGSYIPPAATYPPTVERPGEGGGTPAVTPSNPKQGSTVTVTPKPKDGYQVDKITVTDRSGKPVAVTKQPDGTYTFKQPGSKVTIEVTYQPIDRPWNNPFADVSESDWYYEAVRFVQERGLMNGYSDGRFGLNDALSRAQLAQILFNKEGRPGVDYLLDFSDVADEAWYTEAIRWATSQGIVDGYGNGTFGPNDPITREQLAVMLWRYSGSPVATNKELHFNDESETSGFALEALRWAVENGILNGYGDGRLAPQGQATRAQVAQMLKNFIENQEENT